MGNHGNYLPSERGDQRINQQDDTHTAHRHLTSHWWESWAKSDHIATSTDFPQIKLQNSLVTTSDLYISPTQFVPFGANLTFLYSDLQPLVALVSDEEQAAVGYNKLRVTTPGGRGAT